jgi:hypothetical protein
MRARMVGAFQTCANQSREVVEPGDHEQDRSGRRVRRSAQGDSRRHVRQARGGTTTRGALITGVCRTVQAHQPALARPEARVRLTPGREGRPARSSARPSRARLDHDHRVLRQPEARELTGGSGEAGKRQELRSASVRFGLPCCAPVQRVSSCLTPSVGRRRRPGKRSPQQPSPRLDKELTRSSPIVSDPHALVANHPCCTRLGWAGPQCPDRLSY